MDACMHAGISTKEQSEWQTVCRRQNNRREQSQDIPDDAKAAQKMPAASTLRVPSPVGIRRSNFQRKGSGKSVHSGNSSQTSSKQSSRQPSLSDTASSQSTVKCEQNTGKGDNSNGCVKSIKPTRDLLQAVAQDIPKNAWRWIFRELMKKNSEKGREENIIQNIEANHDKDLGEQKFQALLAWINCVGDKATVYDLDQALRKHDCASVADKHISGEPRATSKVAQQDSTDGPAVKKDVAQNIEIRRVSVDQSNIQLSQDGNTITFSVPAQILANTKCQQQKPDDVSSHEYKSSIVAILIANIINPNQYPQGCKMKLSDLASKFEEKYGSQLKFRNLGVGKLKPFLVQSSWFTLHKDASGNDIVEQTAPTPSPSADSGVSGMFRQESVISDDTGSEREDYDTAHHSPSETPFRTPDGFARKTLNPIALDMEMGLNEGISAQLLEGLLKRPQSKSLKFVNESEYLDKRKFTCDVVSLWNTPDRQTSYIVVGVCPKSSPPHKRIGVNDIRQDKYYQELFYEGAFSYKPPFRYSEILFEGIRYGVFVIPRSKGYGNGDPCYAENNDRCGLWQQENICYCNPKNSIAGRKATKKIIRWFSALDSVTEFPTSPKDAAEEWNKEWEDIKSQIGGLVRDRVPSLVLSSCNPETRYLGSLGKFPWVKVWDFDPQSKTSGVLKACYDEGLKDRVRVSTWKDAACDTPSDGTTDWVFVRGLEDIADTVIDAQDLRCWSRKVKTSLNAHCRQLAEHCHSKEKPLLVVVLWYDNFQYISHLARLLQKIDDETRDAQFLLIMPHLPKNKMQSMHLEALRQQVGIDRVAQIPLSNLCHNLYHCACPFQTEMGGNYMLPVSDGTYDADINDRDFHWYNEEIEVLYSSPIAQEMWNDTKLGESFFSGGLLQWTDCELGMIDAKRSLYKPLMQNVMGCVRKQTSTVINLFHEPSSGGTTLSRRLLWDLHLITPCAYVGSSSFKPSQVYERLASLYQKTQLPIVLLVDGAVPKLVKELESDKRYVSVPTIILHVQQYTGESSDKTHGSNQHWLTAKVDCLEAMSLLHVFSHSCSKETLVNLRALVEEVKEGKLHNMNEFKQIHVA
ncbi:uncharacterized protein [Amphiura filiformis]|uniref:uncharacterized protein n=1 Tax=Amphiura filiformis TaxID=82378 RepID=UPI003B215A32